LKKNFEVAALVRRLPSSGADLTVAWVVFECVTDPWPMRFENELPARLSQPLGCMFDRDQTHGVDLQRYALLPHFEFH
jgi:hypothetical protein